MDSRIYWITAAIAYLMGSIPTGWLVAKVYHVDIQKSGSGNIGATNVFRVLGKGPGLFVLLFDALKGYAAATWLRSWVLSHFGISTEIPLSPNTEYLPLIGGIGAILGHNYTCWLKFKGGKGIATSAGVIAGWVPWGFLIALVVWLVVFALSAYVSLASIAAAFALPFAVWLTGGSSMMTALAAALGLLAIWKHKPNIERLLAGTETKIGKRREVGTVQPPERP